MRLLLLLLKVKRHLHLSYSSSLSCKAGEEGLLVLAKIQQCWPSRHGMKKPPGCLGRVVAQHPAIRSCICLDGAETSPEALFACGGLSWWVLQRFLLLTLTWKALQCPSNTMGESWHCGWVCNGCIHTPRKLFLDHLEHHGPAVPWRALRGLASAGSVCWKHTSGLVSFSWKVIWVVLTSNPFFFFFFGCFSGFSGDLWSAVALAKINR